MKRDTFFYITGTKQQLNLERFSSLFLCIWSHCHGDVDSSSSCPSSSTKCVFAFPSYSMVLELNTNDVAIIILCFDNTNNQKFWANRENNEKTYEHTYIHTSPEHNPNIFFAIYPLANPKMWAGNNGTTFGSQNHLLRLKFDVGFIEETPREREKKT